MTRSTRPRPSSAMTALAAVATGSLLITGCGGSNSGAAPASNASASAVAGQPSPSPSLSDGPLGGDARERKEMLDETKVSLADATKAATERKPRTRVVEVELDRVVDSKPRWEFTLAEENGTAHRVNVDVESGEATESRSRPDNDDDDRADRAALLKTTKTDVTDAVKAATDRVKGTVMHAELEEDDGSPVWEVSVAADGTFRETTLDVAGTDARILREETED
ncbi:PepSY domain-containing protein [Streptomyces sp. NPDC058374]|uniref:PepSY domain-containing protein n=1 Tax=Streptomyces sp. NPDC058374 TaxID=3346466 RepID=UPI003655F48D